MNAWPMFGHFLAHFLWFLFQTARNHKFSLKIVFFCHFECFCISLEQNSFPEGGGEGNFQFLPNFGQFSQVHLKDEVISRD